MVFSWQRFRDRYPQGAVISQLLGIHQDQFLVRVELRAGGESAATLVTALAADSHLEQAEDRARQRAWALLDGAVPVVTTPINGVRPPAAPLRPAPASPNPPAPPLALSPLPAPELDLLADMPAEPDVETDAPWPEDATAPAGVKDAAPAAVTGVRSLEPSPPPPEAPPPSPTVPLPSVPLPSVPLPPPVDLSDVIAQTEVELRRLGWTQAQGREYLKTTYGKLSRHQLSDEELLEFLLHLESLPSPG